MMRVLLLSVCAALIPLVPAAADAPAPVASFLVLDLGGKKGPDMIARGNKGGGGVYWDSDADGLAERCGWVDPADGLLAIDRDGNGAIDDGSELFGSLERDGFAALAATDMNRDGRITPRDVHVWPRLRVWRDLDGDGRSLPSELSTLEQNAITALLLRGLPAKDKVKGSRIIRTGKYEYSDGTRSGARPLVAVQPDCDRSDTKQVERPDRAAAIGRLPFLPARGKIPGLHDAMGRDYSGPDSLMTRVRRLADAPLESLFDYRRKTDEEIVALMLRWAGVDRADPHRYGLYIDARKVDFLDRATGRRTVPEGTRLDFWQAYVVEAEFNAQLRAVMAPLLLQTAASRVLVGDKMRFDPAAGTMKGAAGLDPDIVSAIHRIVANTPHMDEKKKLWSMFVLLVDRGIGIENISNQDGGLVDAAMRDNQIAGGLMAVIQDALVMMPMEMAASRGMKGFLSENYMTQENISIMLDYVNRRFPADGMVIVSDAATLNLQSCCVGINELQTYLADNGFVMKDITAQIKRGTHPMAAMDYSMVLQGERIVVPLATQKKKGRKPVRYSLTVFIHGQKVDWAWASIEEVR